MNARQILLALLLTGVSFAVIYVLMQQEGTVRLVEVTPGPRTPVDPPSDEHPLGFAGIDAQIKGEGNELRKLRNELARKHAEAVERWKQGAISLREVERLEQQLWVARHRVGEIDDVTLHKNLAELFGRERDRLAILHERGLAGIDSLQRAELYVMRERFLAGEDPRDKAGRDYETVRRAYLERRHEQSVTLVQGGMYTREQMKVDLLELAAEFPPVGTEPVNRANR